MIKKIFSEPLSHFLLIATSFFFIYNFISPAPVDENSVTVTSGRIDQLKSRYKKVWQREPSEEELAKLIQNYVLDEIYTIEGRALGLDIDDGVIRKRLRQKMEFMLQDMAAITPPTEQELNDFYLQQQDKYKNPPQYTFSQRYFSLDTEQAELIAVIELQQERIANKLAPQGENTLLPEHLKAATNFEIRKQFGRSFESALQAAPLNKWHGPVRSGLGLHFIRLEQIIDGVLPALAGVEEQVLADWRYQQNITFKKRFEEKLFEQYQIKIQQEQLVGD